MLIKDIIVKLEKRVVELEAVQPAPQSYVQAFHEINKYLKHHEHKQVDIEDEKEVLDWCECNASKFESHPRKIEAAFRKMIIYKFCSFEHTDAKERLVELVLLVSSDIFDKSCNQFVLSKLKEILKDANPFFIDDIQCYLDSCSGKNRLKFLDKFLLFPTQEREFILKILIKSRERFKSDLIHFLLVDILFQCSAEDRKELSEFFLLRLPFVNDQDTLLFSFLSPFLSLKDPMYFIPLKEPIIELLEKIPQDQVADLTLHLQKILAKFSEFPPNRKTIGNLFRVFDEINPFFLSNYCEVVVPLIGIVESNHDLCCLLSKIAETGWHEMPRSEFSRFCRLFEELASRFFLLPRCCESLNKYLEIFRSISWDDLFVFCDLFIKNTSHEILNAETFNHLLMDLRRIPKDQIANIRSDTIVLANLFEIKNPAIITEVFVNLSKMSACKRERLCFDFQDFLKSSSPQLINFLDVFATLPSLEESGFLQGYLKISEGLSFTESKTLLFQLAKCHIFARDDFLKIAAFFQDNRLDFTDRLRFLDLIEPFSTRFSLEIFQRLTTLLGPLELQDQVEVYLHLFCIPYETQNQILDHLIFHSKHISFLQKKEILQALACIPPESLLDCLAFFIEKQSENSELLVRAKNLISCWLSTSIPKISSFHAYQQERLQGFSSKPIAGIQVKFLLDNARSFFITSSPSLAGLAPPISLCREIFHGVQNLKTTCEKNNPYKIFESLKKFTYAELVANQESVASFEEQELYLNVFHIGAESTDHISIEEFSRVVHEKITSDCLKSMISNFLRRVTSLPCSLREQVLSYIMDISGCTLQELCANFSDPYLLNLLDRPVSDRIPLDKAFFTLIIKHLLDLPNHLSLDQWLSTQEESMVKFSSSIRDCFIGKREGIYGVYNSISDTRYKFPSTTSRHLPSAYQARKHLLKWIQSSVDFLIDENKDFFFDLTGTRETMGQMNHFSLYLKNILYPKLGFSYEIRFDPYTQVLSVELLDKDFFSIVELFHKYFTIDFLIERIQIGVFQEMKNEKSSIYQGISDLLSYMNPEEVWNVEETEKISFDTFSITPKACIALLKDMEILKNIPSNSKAKL